MPRKLIYDQWGGIASVVEHDDLQGTTTFAQYQDLTPYLERNKRMQTADDGYTDSTKWRRRVASIPNVLLLKILRQHGIRPIDFFRKPKAYSKWLRGIVYDPQYSHLLTAPHARPHGHHHV
jgi:hypothetical protein